MQELVPIFHHRYGTSTRFGVEPLSEGLAGLQIDSKHSSINVAPPLNESLKAFTMGFSRFTRGY